jgi:putative tryptophan/tyrosine transport system substrate-binding protein
MLRREFIGLVGGAAAWPLVAQAQQVSRRPWRIAQVLSESGQDLAKVFEQRLRNIGYGTNERITLVTRFFMPQQKAVEDAIQSIVAEIDLLVVWSTFGATAAKKLVRDKPIIFVAVGAPVDIGLVESLARPGGNMTGITFEAAREIYGKRLQILKEIAPGINRVVVLGAKGDPNSRFALESIAKANQTLGLTILPLNFDGGDDLDLKFDEVKKIGGEGLIVVATALTYVHRQRIVDLALSLRIPSCHAFYESVVAGGLVSLGPDMVAMAGQAADYVDKIIHGANPADLPVQQPVGYLLYVNQRTAKAIGLTIPPGMLATADEVIE